MNVLTSSHAYLTLGCSHTRGKQAKQNDRWPEILHANTGIVFEYRRYAKIAVGFLYLVRRTQEFIKDNYFDPKEVYYLVLQKPQPIRYPWWSQPDPPDDKSYPFGLDLVRGRKRSMQEFAKLSKERAAEVAEEIFKKEAHLLVEVTEIFPNAKICYYHYWMDYLIEQVQRPALAEVNNRLGEVATSLGMYNMGIIINPAEIDGVYKDGELIMDTQKIHDAGWIHSLADFHGTRKYYQAVSDKVEEWLRSCSWRT